VVDFLSQEWDYRVRGMHLKHAKMLINPGVDRDGNEIEKFDIETVQLCLQAMVEGVFKDWKEGKAPHTLLCVMYGTPPFIKRFKNIYNYLPIRPAYYEKTAVKEWNEKYGYLVR